MENSTQRQDNPMTGTRTSNAPMPSDGVSEPDGSVNKSGPFRGPVAADREALTDADTKEPERSAGSDASTERGTLCSTLPPRRPLRPATTPEEVGRVVAGYPFIQPRDAERLYDFARSVRARRVLELGTCHGVSACHFAAAVAAEHGTGLVVTVDRHIAAALRPGIEDFARELGLEHIVLPIYERSSYNWTLRNFHRWLRTAPQSFLFDIVFIDGGHLFEVDALAFVLAEPLVRPGGWIVFDDIGHSFASSATAASRRDWAPEELEAKQVRDIVDLLVLRHPMIAEWREDGKFGYARKKDWHEMELPPDFSAQLVCYAWETRRRAAMALPEFVEVPPGLSPEEWSRLVNSALAAARKAASKR